MANGTLAASQIEMLSQSGTGIVTIVPPTTNTNRTLTLPDSTGTLLNTNGGTITGTLTVTGVTTLGNGAVLGVPASGTATNLTGLPISTGVSGLGTGIATALAVNVGTAGAPVVNGGVLGSPNTVGTMPAFTLGGTVSGGGNQINNVVIGTTTPLAGAFTTVGASGTITQTATAATNTQAMFLTGATTGAHYIQMTNTSASALIGVEGSAGGHLSAGGSPYALQLRNTTGKDVQIAPDGTVMSTFSSTGLAVTGTLSATGNLISSGANGALVLNTSAFQIYKTGNDIRVYTESVDRAKFNSSGLAVTGALSSTLDATIQGLTVGLGAGAAATNTVVGSGALSSSGATYTTAIGYQASQTITGSYNTAVGHQAMVGATPFTANRNDAFGYSALSAVTSGAYNSALGFVSLAANTTGSFNVAVGPSALQSNTTASNNTAVGYQAGYSNTTGSGNVFIGYQAGYVATPTGNSYNVAVGFQAGYNLTGANNTLLGQGAGSSITSGNDNTLIGNYNGNQGGLDIRTASNYIVLSDGDGNPRIINNSGQTLLNAVTDAAGSGARLHITGAASQSACSLKIGTDSYPGWYFVNAAGTNVGTISINTASTAYNTSSDYRLKNTIAPMTGALAKVAALKPVTYKWNVDGSDGEGFIAHELAEICPNAVTGEKDAVETYLDIEGNEQTRPNYQGIDTSFLVATLTAAIQELKAEVDSLKAQINGASA